MSNYVLRGPAAKKLEILEKCERSLLHELRSCASAEKLSKGAEKVRAAQLAVLKAKATTGPWATYSPDYDSWISRSVDGLLDEYRGHLGD